MALVASVPSRRALFGALRGQHATCGEWWGIVIGLMDVAWLNAADSATATLGGVVVPASVLAVTFAKARR